jgi:beta-glucosidase
LAADSEVAIVFVTQWTAESIDTSLTLPDAQDVLVQAVVQANPRTIVVLETGGPVLMPWIDHVAGVLEAWYPGTSGASAIANILFGRVNPSGRLPVTFPHSENQTVPYVFHDEDGHPAIDYSEGAAVGYKWYDLKQQIPLFPFGFGLTYTSFAYTGFESHIVDGDVVVSFRVRNTGQHAGQDVPQVYIASKAGGWEAPKRLAGWKKVRLRPGDSVDVSLRVDPRILATFKEGGWQIADGDYDVTLGSSALDVQSKASVHLAQRRLPVAFRMTGAEPWK